MSSRRGCRTTVDLRSTLLDSGSLDGTQFFIEGGLPSTSIALVSRSGKPLVAAVYDPVHDHLFEAVRGRGVTLNGERVGAGVGQSEYSAPTTWFADRSLPSYAYYPRVMERFDVRYVGGAVMNALQLLTVPNSVYAKATKASPSGCAIWDLAAVALMIEEHGGTVATFDGRPLHLNRPESVFFNDVGFAFACVDVDGDEFGDPHRNGLRTDQRLTGSRPIPGLAARIRRAWCACRGGYRASVPC